MLRCDFCITNRIKKKKSLNEYMYTLITTLWNFKAQSLFSLFINAVTFISCPKACSSTHTLISFPSLYFHLKSYALPTSTLDYTNLFNYHSFIGLLFSSQVIFLGQRFRTPKVEKMLSPLVGVVNSSIAKIYLN